jgi:tetratricopeptide (TPR) repeat protein
VPTAGPTKLAASLHKSLTASLVGATRVLASASAKGAIARGKVLQLAGYWEDAADSYAQALSSAGDADEAAARLVIAQLLSRQMDKALATATSLASRNPRLEVKELTSNRRVSALTLLGDALAQNGRLPDAIDAYERARKTVPKDAFAAGRLAEAFLASGEPAKAVALRREVATNPRFRDLSLVLERGAENPNLLPRFSATELQNRLSSKVPGRPILVEGTALVAPLVDGDDTWCSEAL